MPFSAGKRLLRAYFPVRCSVTCVTLSDESHAGSRAPYGIGTHSLGDAGSSSIEIGLIAWHEIQG